MVAKKKEEKREQFGLKTKSMPERVFLHLDQKAKSREIVKYIVELVEADLDKKASIDTSDIDKLRKEMLSEFTKLNNRISSLSFVHAPINYKGVTNDDEITEGQLIDEEVKVLGTIEEEYELDL